MDLTPIDNKRIRKIDGKKSSFSVIEHSYRSFEKELSAQADRLYSKMCLDADKNGMSFHSIRGLKERLRYGQDTIYSCLKQLAGWGLLLYEKREDGYAVQVLPVPNYDLMKTRHVTVHIHTNSSVIGPRDIAEKLKIFDDAIQDPGQKSYVDTLKRARKEFLDAYTNKKTTT